MSTYQSGNFPGMAVVIAIEDSIIWKKGYGYSDMESKTPVDPEKSVFRIGSISKTLTAAALANLVEEGKVDPHASVNQYVSYFPIKRYPLTVRQVACHIGGIRHYRGNEFLINKPFSSVKEGIDIFDQDSLLFEPGSKYRYSSYGWNLISGVIEGASNQDFLTYMDEKVFDPLKMDQTYAEKGNDQIDGLVSFYMHDYNGLITPGQQVNNSYKWAGGGFLASATELVKFSKGVLSNTIYNQEVQDLFWESCHLKDGTINNYGMGWAVNTDDDGREWVGHSGGSMGGTSMYLLYPEYNLTVVTLVNLSSARMNRLAFQLADVILDHIESKQ